MGVLFVMKREGLQRFDLSLQRRACHAAAVRAAMPHGSVPRHKTKATFSPAVSFCLLFGLAVFCCGRDAKKCCRKGARTSQHPQPAGTDAAASLLGPLGLHVSDPGTDQP